MSQGYFPTESTQQPCKAYSHLPPFYGRADWGSSNWTNFRVVTKLVNIIFRMGTQVSLILKPGYILSDYMILFAWMWRAVVFKMGLKKIEFQYEEF